MAYTTLLGQQPPYHAGGSLSGTRGNLWKPCWVVPHGFPWVPNHRKPMETRVRQVPTDFHGCDGFRISRHAGVNVSKPPGNPGKPV